MLDRILAAFFEPELMDLMFGLDLPLAGIDGGTLRVGRSRRDRAVSTLAQVLTARIREARDVAPPPDLRAASRRVDSVLGPDSGIGWDPVLLLSEMAQYFLSERDDRPAFKWWSTDGHHPSGTWKALYSEENKLSLWRDLVYRIDVTPILAAAFALHQVHLGHPAISDEVEPLMSDRMVSSILARGLAETHVHLGSSFSFRALVRELLDFEVLEENGRKASARREFIHDVVRRLADQDDNDGTEISWEAGPRLEPLGVLVGLFLIRDYLIGRAFPQTVPVGLGEDTMGIVAEISRAGSPSAWVNSLKVPRLWEHLEKMQRLVRSSACDDLARIVVRNETAFLTSQLGMLLPEVRRTEGSRECDLKLWARARVLMLYLQLKNILYRRVVHRFEERGFRSFRDQFVRMKAVAPAHRLVWEAVRDPWSEIIEVRINPAGSYSDLARTVGNILLAQRLALLDGGSCPLVSGPAGSRAASKPGPARLGCPVRRGSSTACTTPQRHVCHDHESFLAAARGLQPRGRRFSQTNSPSGRRSWRVGIICHFVKPDSEPREARGEPRRFSKQTALGTLEKLATDSLRAAANIIDLMEQVPMLADYLVGIDVANVETAAPNFVYYPALGLLRAAWQSGGGGRTGSRRSLGLTFHAGEDFYDIVSALRTIDMVVEGAGLKAGDRIGHGFAAGVDVDWWCDEHCPAPVTLEDEVLDRLWEWHLVRAGVLPGEEFSSREVDLIQLATEWLDPGEPVNPAVLWRMLEIRHEAFLRLLLDNGVVRECLGPWIADRERRRQQHRLGGSGRYLDDLAAVEQERLQDGMRRRTGRALPDYLARYFLVPEVWARGQKVRHVVHDAGARARIGSMQEYLCAKLASKGITVEANISSNYVIVKMGKVACHPVFRWKEPGGRLNTGMAVSINTDNPAIFNTNLETEFALLFHGALEGGRSREEALELVEQLRLEGMHSTFVRREFRSLEHELYCLCKVVESLRRARSRSLAERGRPESVSCA